MEIKGIGKRVVKRSTELAAARPARAQQQPGIVLDGFRSPPPGVGGLRDSPSQQPYESSVEFLQAACNRWARFLKVRTLDVDGVVGPRTFEFTRQLVAGYVTGRVWGWFFTTFEGGLTWQDLAANQDIIQGTAEAINAQANTMGVDGTWATSAQLDQLETGIAAANDAIAGAAGAAAGTSLVPTSVTGGGAPAWLLWGGIGAAGVGLAGLVALLVRHRKKR